MITPKEIIERLRAGDFEAPSRLADYLVILSASLSAGGLMELETEIHFSEKWQELRRECDSDKQCDMKAKLLSEYVLMKTAQINNKTILEVIRSLKKKLQNLEIEYREGQNF